MTEKDEKENKKVKEEVKEQETKPVKRTPQPKKKKTKKQTKKPKEEPKELVHIDAFLDEITHRTDLSMAQATGFKAYMNGNHYAKSFKHFMSDLEKYLGKKVG